MTMTACTVCFGAAEPIVRESLNAGIFVLLGTTVVVLACFARFFLTLARRARAVRVTDPPISRERAA